MSFILFDLEVTKYDFLCGFKNIDTGERTRIWNDPDAVREYINAHQEDHMFVAFNNYHYDDHIIQTVLKRKDPYKVSKGIIEKTYEAKWARVPYTSLDVADLLPPGNSLKALESDLGLSIEESSISFDIDRPLTPEERVEMEGYNDHDIDALEFVFKIVSSTSLRTKFDMIDYFGLNLKKTISRPLPTIMAQGLNARRGFYPEQPWETYPTLLVDEETRKFLEAEAYLKGSRTFMLAEVPHKMGLGGLHGALPNHSEEWGWILDVKGYYTLIQLKYRLLSRSLGEEGYEKVWELYHERLRRAGIGDETAASLKEGVLSIWGAVKNKFHLLYDPAYAVLITLTGQAFLVDLIQKIEPYIRLIQSNTDGIFIVPRDGLENGEDAARIKEQVEAWVKRTGFELSIDRFTRLWQKDVNNYACIVNDKKIKAKGSYINCWDADKESFLYSVGRRRKQGAVVDKALVHYFLYGKPLADTIEEENDLSLFQYTARKVGSNFTDVLLRETDKETGAIAYLPALQKVNRVFAVKPDYKPKKWEFVKVKPRDFSKLTNKEKEPLSEDEIQSLQDEGEKYYDENGQLIIDLGIQQADRIPNMPDDVFVYNRDMREPQAREYILARLDRQYYIDDAQKKLNDYMGIKPPKVKKIKKLKVNLNVYSDQEFSDLEMLLAGIKPWKAGEGMIGETVYDDFKIDGEAVGKTLFVKNQDPIVIDYEEAYKFGQEPADLNTGSPITFVIKKKKSKRAKEEIRIDKEHTIIITDCGDYGIEVGLFKGKKPKLLDQRMVEDLEEVGEVTALWIDSISAQAS